jgi:citronellyl-CoA dehydrogenase
MFAPFKEEHQQFRAMVRAFVEKEIVPFADVWEKDRTFPNELFRKAGELGILGAHFAVDHGGGGGDYWFSVVKAEEYPRGRSAGVAMSLLVQSDMATPVIADLGTPEQLEEFLRPALRGQKVAALGVSEPNAGSDVAAIRTVARRDGSDYVIDGQKTFITNGTRADFVTLLVKTRPDEGAHGCSFFLVPTSLPGFAVSRKLEKIGNHASDTAELFFDGVRVPARYLLGEENQGFAYLMQNFQTERLVTAVSAVAVSRLSFEDAIAYGKQRVAFGRPILTQGVWRHRMVDLCTKIEMAQAFVYQCADRYNEERYVQKQPLSLEAAKLISMAKIAAGELATEVTDTCLQFHGGWGYLEDFPIARAYRDQRLLRIGAGTTEVLRYYLANLMGW